MKYVLISGSVQNVGFRQFVKSKANKLNIKGWVKNLPNGRVEIMASGDKENLNKFVDLCRKGPFLAIVKELTIEEVEDMDFENFEIIKD